LERPSAIETRMAVHLIKQGMNYIIFKSFVVHENYNKVIEYVKFLIKQCIENYGTYNIHINIDTFTVSAAERYKNIITSFMNNCINENTNYSFRLNKLYIYNTPNSFQTISTILLPLIDPSVKSKIFTYDKNNSVEILKLLFKFQNEVESSH